MPLLSPGAGSHSRTQVRLKGPVDVEDLQNVTETTHFWLLNA